ncbi:hypothetical protein ABEB36_011642 [Hypothenemus hampei]|uniref:Elongation of very long chain fatty acids protein n=1 Tax=Hypothenemus hampei TaxID=57062 RepID=A0ABD1E9A7_HYPHA
MGDAVGTFSENTTLSKSMWDVLFVDLADPRTSSWFLMDNPLPVIGILIIYLYSVKVMIPNYMATRKPYNLKTTIMIYNIFQVIFNIILFREAWLMWIRYNWFCQDFDRSNSPRAMRDTVAAYLYFLNKISDLTDTFFFTLRKKNNQVTFLHIYHHSLMPMIGWIMVKYVPGGHITFVGLLNTFVHVILYGYYFLAGLGPEMQKYLWWKKYLTKLQLLQFLLVILHNLLLFFGDCGFPKWTLFLILPNTVLFYYLFNDFYNKNYIKPKHDVQNKKK